MTKIIAVSFIALFALFSISCGTADANGRKVEAVYGLISATSDYTDGLSSTELQAAVQEGLTKGGVDYKDNSLIKYSATSKMDKTSGILTVCITSSDISLGTTNDYRILPGGCVNVGPSDYSSDTKLSATAMLPKAAEKLTALIRSELNPSAAPAANTSGSTVAPKTTAPVTTANAANSNTARK